VTQTRIADSPLRARFYARPAETVARALLGTRLVSTVGGETTVGRIVEVEAYLGPHDEASHAAARIGRTARNATMFGRPGIAYVYRIYGVHWCLNVVTDALDFPGAVLIRAIEPVQGIDIMQRRRATRDEAALGRGPGNLARALGVTGSLDGHALDRPPLILVRGAKVDPAEIAVSPRIGVTRAKDWPLRFYIRSSPSVSRRR
jgi:DNA-3-methyladenine glycosylase